MKNSKKHITIFSKEVILNFKIILIAILIAIIIYITYYFTNIYPIYKNIESAQNSLLEKEKGFDEIKNKVIKYYDYKEDIEYSSYQDLLNKRGKYYDFLWKMYENKNRNRNNFDEYYRDVTFELSKKMVEWDLKSYKNALLTPLEAESLINRDKLTYDDRQYIQNQIMAVNTEKENQIEFTIYSVIYSVLVMILARYLIIFIKFVIKNSKNEM